MEEELQDPINLSEKALKKKQQFEEIYKLHEQEIQNQKIEKSEKQKLKNPRELAIAILAEFTERFKKIISLVENCTEASEIDHIFELYTDLQKYYLEQNYAMNNYDKYQYKEQLDNIDKKIKELRERTKPRKKFAFSKKPQIAQCQQQPSEQTQSTDATTRNQDFPAAALANLEGVENLDGETLIMQQSQQSSIKICNNKNSTIKINALLDCVYLENNQNCKIFLGPTKFSIMLTNINNCEVAIMSHQIRIHNSNNTLFQIFSSSKSIIENCSQLKFSKYNYSYDQFEEQFKISGLSGKDNLWKEIQDFNWLKQEKSPNFELIELN